MHLHCGLQEMYALFECKICLLWIKRRGKTERLFIFISTQCRHPIRFFFSFHLRALFLFEKTNKPLRNWLILYICYLSSFFQGFIFLKNMNKENDMYYWEGLKLEVSGLCSVRWHAQKDGLVCISQSSASIDCNILNLFLWVIIAIFSTNAKIDVQKQAH